MATATQIQIGTLATDRVVAVEPTTTLRDAAEVLASESVGAVLIEDVRGLLGLLSERDIVRAVADGADVDEERASDWGADDLLTVTAETPVIDALTLMRGAEIRHIVVTRPGGHGIVSMREATAALEEA